MAEATTAWYQPVVDFGSKAGAVITDGAIWLGQGFMKVMTAVAEFAKEWFNAGIKFAGEHPGAVIATVCALAIGIAIGALAMRFFQGSPATQSQ